MPKANKGGRVVKKRAEKTHPQTRASRLLTPRKYGRTVPAVGPGARLQVDAAKQDGWANVYTALGVSSRDKRTGVVQCPTILDFRSLEDLYRGDDMAARIVELFPDEMLRRGFTVFIPNDDETADKVNARFDELEMDAKIHRALCWQRAYGGAGIFIGANDGKAADQPLDENAVRSVDWFTVFDSQELRPVAWYTDPEAQKFSEPEMFGVFPKVSLSGSTLNMREFNRAYAQGMLSPTRNIHESRIIPFRGAITSRTQERTMMGWGDSVLIRCYEVLQDFAGAFGSTANLMQDFAQAVLYLHGLAEVVSGNDTDMIRGRAEAIDIGRSALRAIMLDSEDRFERATTPVTGLADLLDKFMLRLSAAAGYPVTLLFGQSPAGLQATGETDTRWFYDKVSSHQKKVLRPVLRKITRLLFKDLDIEEPKEWDVRFPPLWQLSELEEAKRRLLVAQADAQWISSQVLKPSEVAVARFSGAQFDPDLTIEQKDVDEREKAVPAVMVEGTPSSGPTSAPNDPHKNNVGSKGEVKTPDYGIPGGER